MILGTFQSDRGDSGADITFVAKQKPDQDIIDLIRRNGAEFKLINQYGS